MPESRLASPSPPDLLAFLTIGFNSTTRQLEALARKSVPRALASHLHTSQPALNGQSQLLQNFVAIFVPRSSQPSILYAHLPLLIATASLASSFSPPIRLVTLPKVADARLSAALALPRVGLIGLMEGAPHSAALSDYVREHVSKVEVPWLNEAKAGKYLPLKVKAVQMMTPLIQKEAVNGKRETPDGHSEGPEVNKNPRSAK
ncbi:MAG: hypothetical protein M1830_004803 [Pleopsidium flavum]|nr:MAG: hypothetical protein M1830_004803 [Pleopsidium flavum]